MTRLPWVLEESVRRALRLAPGASPREALEETLAALPAARQVEQAFAWLLGRAPDAGALAYHVAQMSAAHDGTRWLVECLARCEAPPPAPPHPGVLSRFDASPGDAAGESFPGEAVFARRLLDETDALDDAGFLAEAYRRVLGREADAGGLLAYGEALASGRTNRPRVMRDLLWSEELRRPSAGRSMAEDWDARARENALFYIASGASTSEEEFRRSGEVDVEEIVLAGLEVDPAAAVVEIGCGVGRLLAPLAARVREVHGLDISPVMVERARAFCAPAANVRVSVTDGTLATLADASADLVFSYIVFQHVPEAAAIERYLHEAARVLRPGGLLRVQVDGRWRLRRHADSYDGVKLRGPELRAMVARAGLDRRGEWGEDTHYYWLDATRGDGAGTRVRLLPRRLNQERLVRLLGEAGVQDAPGIAREVAAGERSLRSVLGPALGTLPEEPLAFVGAAFALLLGRAPRQDEAEFHARPLEKGWADRDEVFDALVTCGPFRNRLEPLVSR